MPYVVRIVRATGDDAHWLSPGAVGQESTDNDVVALDPQPPKTPSCVWVDCPGCGTSTDPANRATPLRYDTVRGECCFDGVQTTPGVRPPRP